MIRKLKNFIEKHTAFVKKIAKLLIVKVLRDLARGTKYMSTANLEERVAALESEVARLSRQLALVEEPGRDDWKSTVGMFANDPIMKEILDEARKIREHDREKTRG